MSLCEKGSSWIVKLLENRFYDWGCFVARRPWAVIVISLIVTSICSIGFYKFTSETDPNKLWIPRGSAYLANKQWLSENFPQNKRVQTIIFKSENGNILSPESLKQMLKLHKTISKLKPSVNNSFDDICER